MYTLHLSDSQISAQEDDIVREVTVGDLLREVAVERASATALLEVDMEGQTGRSWTYSELLSDSEQLALSLTSRYSQGATSPGTHHDMALFVAECRPVRCFHWPHVIARRSFKPLPGLQIPGRETCPLRYSGKRELGLAIFTSGLNITA